MRFSKLVRVFEDLESVSSHIRLRKLLSGFFRKVPGSDLSFVAYLCLGVIDAEYKKTDLGLAEKMVMRAIARASEMSVEEVWFLSKKTGDLGFVAEKIVRKEGSLSVKRVIDTLRQISVTSGVGSQDRKIDLLSNLLVIADPLEAKYIVRIVLGRLRLGVASATVIDSLALAFSKDRLELEHAYDKTSDIGLIARLASSKKPLKVGITVGIPVKMMLAQRIKSLVELKKHFSGLFTAEEKYDGERVQVHKIGSELLFFSRRLEDITSQYPDVLASLKKSVKAGDCVFEGEIVAVDKKGILLPFQLLMRRRRKYRVEEFAKKVPVSLFCFDLLFLDGKSFVDKPYPVRREALERILKPSGIVQLARQIVTDDLVKVQKFFNLCVSRGAEGIIAKSMGKDSFYKAGSRGWFWIKWKKDYLKGVKDTYDLVVVGAFAGKGRRAGTYGSLLCAVYDKSRDLFLSFTKLGAGFTDKTLAALPKLLSRYKSSGLPARVVLKKGFEPDFFFKPGLVVEVLGAEVTKSPLHSSGFALRFPRFIRFRGDKSPEQATTVSEVRKMK